MFRYAGDPVVRSGLPEPVGSRFGKVTKALLALAKRNLCQLAVLDIGSRPIPFDDVAHLIAQWLVAEQKPAIFTVEAPEPCFGLASHTGDPYRAPRLQLALDVVRMNNAGPVPFQGLVQ